MFRNIPILNEKRTAELYIFGTAYFQYIEITIENEKDVIAKGFKKKLREYINVTPRLSLHLQLDLKNSIVF